MHIAVNHFVKREKGKGEKWKKQKNKGIDIFLHSIR